LYYLKGANLYFYGPYYGLVDHFPADLAEFIEKWAFNAQVFGAL
jgi:hypothetical protein